MVETFRSVSSSESGDDFWISDTTGIGGRYQGEGRPFFFELHALPFYDLEADELEGVAAAFGRGFQTAVTVAAMCNDVDDHRVLAELCLHLATGATGVVDYGGLLPRLPSDPSTLAGRCVALDSCHYSDTEFLEAWMSHPDFRLVK